MPELPEVETVRCGLLPVLEGRRLVRVDQRRPDLRFPFPIDFVARLQGQRIEQITRRAKYLLVHLSSGETLLCHLGMSGRMLLLDDPLSQPVEKHDHVIFATEEGKEVRFNDVRRFGFMDLIAEGELESSKHLAHLGPEPLGNAFNGPALAKALAGKKGPIKMALLDQKVVAGLGNIYVCEALFMAGISPKRIAGTIQGQRAERLAASVRDVLTKAIAAGGSSLRDFVQASGELGYFQHQWLVYGREDDFCRTCHESSDKPQKIKRLVQSGRSTFYCPACQR